MKYISEERCSACGRNGPNDIDHIKSRGSGGTDDEFNLWVLCRGCHQDKHHYGLNALLQCYPHLIDILESKGWDWDSYKGKWVRYKPGG